jgi:hypothetical protein
MISAIQKVVAQRAHELGGRDVRPRDVRVEMLEQEAAPGCRVFHARWVNGALSGLLRDVEPPDTYPAQALGKIFRRWLERGGLPDARHVAQVATWLFDPERRRTVVLSEADVRERRDWLRHVRPPELIDADGSTGVVFWWINPLGPSELRVVLEDDGFVDLIERPIHEFPHA